MLPETNLKIYFGDAANFHEREFRTSFRIAGKSGDQKKNRSDVKCLRRVVWRRIRRGTRGWLR